MNLENSKKTSCCVCANCGKCVLSFPPAVPCLLFFCVFFAGIFDIAEGGFCLNGLRLD